MASIRFEEGVKIIPTSVKTFPIKIIKEGVKKLAVKVIFKSPKNESIETIKKGEAINNIKGGHYRGINKELTWDKGEVGEKVIYVDILKEKIVAPLSFEIELKLVSSGTINLRYCRCTLVNNLQHFLDQNVYSKDENIDDDKVDLFDLTENKKLIPVLLNEELNEVEGLLSDVDIKENELKTNYINKNLFHIDGNIRGKIFFPEEEIFNELELEGCYVGLKIPFENMYKSRKRINTYSETKTSAFLKEESNIMILTNSEGTSIFHEKNGEKELDLHLSLESFINLKVL